jgi:hypothetical protein
MRGPNYLPPKFVAFAGQMTLVGRTSALGLSRTCCGGCGYSGSALKRSQIHSAPPKTFAAIHMRITAAVVVIQRTPACHSQDYVILFAVPLPVFPASGFLRELPNWSHLVRRFQLPRAQENTGSYNTDSQEKEETRWVPAC